MELFNGKLCLIWIICATKDYLKHKLKAAMLLKLRESYQSDKINVFVCYFVCNEVKEYS